MIVPVVDTSTRGSTARLFWLQRRWRSDSCVRVSGRKITHMDVLTKYNNTASLIVVPTSTPSLLVHYNIRLGKLRGTVESQISHPASPSLSVESESRKRTLPARVVLNATSTLRPQAQPDPSKVLTDLCAFMPINSDLARSIWRGPKSASSDISI